MAPVSGHTLWWGVSLCPVEGQAEPHLYALQMD